MNVQDQLIQENNLKVDAIERLINEEVDEPTLITLIGLLTNENRGLRNAVANFLICNSNPLIPQYIVDLIQSENIAIRNLAGEILIKKSSFALKAILKKLSFCDHVDHIKFLVDILGLIGDKNAEDQILNVLSSNDDENVVLACIEALGNLKSVKALEPILNLFDKDDRYKAVVIDAAGKIGTDRVLDFITTKLKTNDEMQQFIILESLGELGNENTFYSLLSQMNEMSGILLCPLLESIYKLKEKYNLDVPFDDKMKKCVLEIVLNAEPRYQKVAAHLVTVFDDPDILYACLVVYGYDAELDKILFEKFLINKRIIILKIHSLIGVERTNIQQRLNLLKSLLECDKDFSAQSLAIEHHKLIEALSKCLSSPDELVRITSAQILYLLNPESILLFLDRLVEDENIWNKLSLLDIIAEINHPDIIVALEKLSNDPDEMVREKASEIFNQKQYAYKVKVTEKR